MSDLEKIIAEMAAATDALESSNYGIEGWRIDLWIAELRESAAELLRRCEPPTGQLPLGFISKFDHDYMARGGIGQCQVVIHARRPRKDAVPIYLAPPTTADATPAQTGAELPEYTEEIGKAGDSYIASLSYGDHTLPARFRWNELWNALTSRALSADAETKCNHANTSAGYDYASCLDCGAFRTDSGWGIARCMWFANREEAVFYRKNGRLPENLK